jgi:RNA polymerase-associated protein LEO1
MNSDDEEMMLFGEKSSTESAIVVADEATPVTVTVNDRIRFGHRSDGGVSKLMKLPSSALSINFKRPYDPSVEETEPTSAAVIRYRLRNDASFSIESNSRLVEWEDGSWTLVIGNEHFRVFERDENVAIFDRQQDMYISIEQVEKQLNVIPGSLDSRTHKRVVEQTAVNRKLAESRKVFLASGISSATVTSQGSLPTQTQRRTRPMTAAFLEAGLAADEGGGSVRDIKSRYKSPAKRSRQESSSEDEEEDEEDVDFIDDEEESESSSDSDSSSSSSSRSSSSNSSSSSSSRD